MTAERILSSFRDPSGYVFRQDGAYFRRITPQGLPDYGQFLRSGLADELVKAGLLVPFEEISRDASGMRGSETVDYVAKIRQRHAGYQGVKSPYQGVHSSQPRKADKRKNKYDI